MSIAADSYMSLNKTIKCNQLSHHCDFELLTIDIRSKNVISNQRGKGNKNLGNDQKKTPVKNYWRRNSMVLGSFCHLPLKGTLRALPDSCLRMNTESPLAVRVAVRSSLP